MPYYTKIGSKTYDRALLEAFERSVRGRGDGRVSGDDVKTEIQKRVKDGGKLTDVEIDTLRYAADKFNITGRGQSELSDLVESLSGQQVFAWQNVGNTVGVQAGTREQAALWDAAAAFVRDNAADGASVRDPHLFPGVDSSNMGLFAYSLDGDAAARFHRFMNATLGQAGRDKLAAYDPAQHNLIAVRVTFDEEQMHVAMQDKATGKVELVGDIAYVDEVSEYSFDSADDFEAKTGVKLDDIPGTDRQYWSEIDAEELAQYLVRGGRLLDLHKSDDVYGRPTSKELESAAWDLDSTWGDENIMDGAVEAKAGQMPFGLDLGAQAVRIMEQELRWDDMTWSAAPKAGVVRGLTDAAIKDAAKMVHEGFGYAPQNTPSLDDNTARIEGLLKKLGKRSDLKVVVAEGKGTPDHITGADPLLTKTFLFFNEKTGDFAAVTARDATL